MRRLMIVLMMVGGLFAAVPTAVAISPSSTTTVWCPPAVEVNVAASCTVNVHSGLPNYGTPNGTVTLSSSGAGVFGSGGSCTVIAVTVQDAACTITYTPTSIGTDPVHTLTAAYVNGGSGHNPGSGATTIQVVKQAQQITLPNVFAGVGRIRDYGALAGGASGNPIRYSIDPATTNQACRIEPTKGFVVGDGIRLAFLRVGECVIRATQAGNAEYLPGVATQTLVVKNIQTVRWVYPKVPEGSVGGTSRLLASSEPGLPVTYQVYPSTTNGACMVTQTTVTYLAPGNCVLAANAPGNASYHPTVVTTTITVR